MGFITEETGQEFIARLNERVAIENGGVVVIGSDERRGQKLLTVIDRKPLELARNVDLVILGPCSDLPFNPTEEFPMGLCIKEHGKDEPDRSWLHAVLKSEIKDVLLISGCCGSFPDWYLAMLRRVFPGVNWITPNVPDFYDYLWACDDKIVRLTEILMEEGVIK